VSVARLPKEVSVARLPKEVIVARLPKEVSAARLPKEVSVARLPSIKKYCILEAGIVIMYREHVYCVPHIV